MRVCIIAEGSYPYITGGVSSWVHELIRGLPGIDFKLLSIMPTKAEKLEYRYTLPKNLLEVNTVFLDEYLNLNHKTVKKKIRLSDKETECIARLLSFDSEYRWGDTIRLISNKKKIGDTIDFLQSEIFWNAVLKLYKEKYPDESFNTFFWTIRSMFLPFINLFQHSIVQADIYHSVSTGYAGMIGVYYRIATNKPLILTEHGIYAREREEEIIKAKWVTGIYKKLWIDLFYFMSKIAYKEADRIVSLFQRSHEIQLELGALKEKARIISNGADFERFNVVKKEHDGGNVGAILRIVPIKDVMTLIRAFKIVKDAIKDAKLYLVGPVEEDSDYYNNCKDLIRLLQLENHIVFTGSVDIREYLKILDVLVLTSISEGQPLVILEGMSAGIPFVATDVGSCKELLDENEYEGACGYITNLVSPSETAVRIIKLLEDRNLRESMGANSKKRVKRAYSREKFLSSYRKLYEELD